MGYPGLEKYNRLQVSIPIGMGFNININDKMNFGFEVGFRKTFCGTAATGPAGITLVN